MLITAKNTSEFIPSGYVVSQKIQGDLNKDKQEDEVLIIKGTDKANFVNHETRGKLDRNRRGIIIALKTNAGYELALDNLECFVSENEDGGVYLPPDMDVYIEKGNLIIHYYYGRYGWESYNFRYQNSDFELIGYDISERQWGKISKEVSINFMTKNMLIRENINIDAEDEIDEIFKETWKKFSLSKPLSLKEITEFNGFNPLSLLETVK